MTYLVKLPTFEGPLDLLLFLIREARLDIHDIPIAQITDQYLEYIELMQDLRLDLAGEFFVMAATLMRIKIRMLLPRDATEEEEEDEVDPREELVQRLLEYRKIKEAARELRRREAERRQVFPRARVRGRPAPEPDPEEASGEFSLFDLLYALKDVLAQVRAEGVHHVRMETVSLDERIETIRERLAGEGQILFADLFQGSTTKMEIIVTFMALLELLKGQEIRARQETPFEPIWLYRRPGDEIAGELGAKASQGGTA